MGSSHLDGRFIYGRSFKSGERTVITPYFGIGNRELDDGFEHPEAYARMSEYVYSPIGVEIESDVGQKGGWGIIARLEYDHLWKGNQNTQLGYVQGIGYIEPIDNVQRNGSGQRISAELFNFRKGGSKRFGVSVFARGWDMADSELADIPEIPRAQPIEPPNKTLQRGINLTYSLR